MSNVLDEPITITGLASHFPSNAKAFKQLQVDMILEIPTTKPEIEHILHDMIDIKINDTTVLRTSSSKSHEGQILTDYKLIINGEILHKIEYIADNSIQSAHAAEFSTNFSSYIILDEHTYQSTAYKVTPYVEDIFIKLLDSRTIFKNVTFILDAIPTNNELHDNPCFEPNGVSSDCSPISIPTRHFSQFSCAETIILPSHKPNIEQIVSVIVDPEIMSVKFINTMKGNSIEGQHLTGKMAIIEIKFKQKILYATDSTNQTIHGMESAFFKSTYIIMPLLIEGTDPQLLYKSHILKIKLTIEDLYSTKRGKRSIFENLCVLAELELVPTYELCYSSYHNCVKSELFLCFEDGSRNTQITKCNNSKSIKPAWSPNGGQIAYLSGAEDCYTLMNFTLKNNSHDKLISHEAFENISSFTWLKDGQHIVFTGVKHESKELYLYNMANRTYWKITDGAGLIKSYYPKTSPDGYSVAFLRSSLHSVDLWCSDIHGKNQRKVTNASAIRDYDWMPDVKALVYIDCKNEDCFEIYLDAFDKQHPLQLISCDSLYDCKNVSVSPDGLYIAFVGTNRCSDDIYVYDMEKGKLSNITNHQNSIKINSLVWKISCSKIYYAAKEYVYFDIYAVDMVTKYKERLTHTESSYMHLSYRPRIK